MKQVVMLVAAGLMALVLTGCEDKPKQPETNNTTIVQPQPKEETKVMEEKTDTAAPASGQSQE